MPKYLSNKEARSRARYADGGPISKYTAPTPPPDPLAPILAALQMIMQKLDELNEEQKACVMEASYGITAALQVPKKKPEQTHVFTVLERDKNGKCVRFSITGK